MRIVITLISILPTSFMCYLSSFPYYIHSFFSFFYFALNQPTPFFVKAKMKNNAHSHTIMKSNRLSEHYDIEISLEKRNTITSKSAQQHPQCSSITNHKFTGVVLVVRSHVRLFHDVTLAKAP